ncbi:2'-5' RNA ligase family protein [Paenibacillus tarimensis]
MYAVELFFEDSFEQYVRGIWKGLKEEQISSNMYDIADIRPHITLAVYNDIPSLDTFADRSSAYFDKVPGLELQFDALAFFPTTGTLFIGPTVTEGLIRLHAKYHEHFKDLLEFTSRFYIPGNWHPHCTLAINLSREQMLEAMNYCYKDFTPRRSKIIEAGIVKIAIESNHRCVSSPTVAAKRLFSEG